MNPSVPMGGKSDAQTSIQFAGHPHFIEEEENPQNSLVPAERPEHKYPVMALDVYIYIYTNMYSLVM